MVHTQKKEFKIVRVVVLGDAWRCRDFAGLKRTYQAGRDEYHQLRFISAVLYVPEEGAENWDVTEQRDTSIGGANTVIQHACHREGVSAF